MVAAVPTVNVPANNVGTFTIPFPLIQQTQELPTKLWQIQDDRFGFNSVTTGSLVMLEKGFITDGCSIPHLPFVYLLAGGKADPAGYLHDQEYTRQRFTRETCDLLLREMVLAMGYSVMLADAMYLAVREFGGSHWDLPNVPQPPEVDAAFSRL